MYFFQSGPCYLCSTLQSWVVFNKIPMLHMIFCVHYTRIGSGRAVYTQISPLTLLVAGSWLPLLVARGGGCLGPPLRSPVLTSRFLKFKRHSFRLNVIYISKKRNFKKSQKRGIRGAKTMNFRNFFDHVLPARLWTDFNPTSGIR